MKFTITLIILTSYLIFAYDHIKFKKDTSSKCNFIENTTNNNSLNEEDEIENENKNEKGSIEPIKMFTKDETHLINNLSGYFICLKMVLHNLHQA